MANRKIISYWLLLLVVLLTASMVLSVGETQAHYINTTVWNTVFEPQDDAVTSNYLVSVSDAPLTVLLGEMPLEKYTVTFPLEAAGDASGSLAWSVDQPEYLTVEMSVDDVSLTESSTIALEMGIPVIVTMTLVPTENALATIHDAMDINVEVTWSNSLKGTFRVTLPAVSEADLPTEEEPEASNPDQGNEGDTDVPPEDGDDSNVDDPNEDDSTGTGGSGTDGEDDAGESGESGGTDTDDSTNTDDNTDSDDSTDADNGTDTDNSTGENADQTQPGESGNITDSDTQEEEPGIASLSAEDGGDAAVPTQELETVPAQEAETVSEEGNSTQNDDAGSTPVAQTESNTTTDPATQPAAEPTTAPPTDPATEPVTEPTVTPSAPAQDTPSSDGSTAGEGETVQLATISSFDPTGVLPVRLTLTEGITQVVLGMGTSGETGGEIRPFPASTRFSLDDGASYYMLYYEGIISIDPQGDTQTTVLLDFSDVRLEEDEDVVVTAEAYVNETRINTASSSAKPDVDQQYQIESRILSKDTSLEIILPESWRDYTLAYSVEMLSANATSDKDSAAEHVSAKYINVDLTTQSLIVDRVSNENEHTLTLKLGETLPPAGTYRVNMKWTYKGICFAQAQTTFFINYSVYSESDRTGGTEQ